MDPHRRKDAQRTDPCTRRADDGASLTQDRSQTDRPQECALTGHIRPRHEEEPTRPVDGHVAWATYVVTQERMSQRFSLEDGLTRPNLGEAPLGVVVGECGERGQCLELAKCMAKSGALV